MQILAGWFCQFGILLLVVFPKCKFFFLFFFYIYFLFKEMSLDTVTIDDYMA